MLRSGYTSAIQHMRSGGGGRVPRVTLSYRMKWRAAQATGDPIPEGRREEGRFNCSRFDTGLRSRDYGDPQQLFIKKQIVTKEGGNHLIKEELTEKKNLEGQTSGYTHGIQGRSSSWGADHGRLWHLWGARGCPSSTL